MKIQIKYFIRSKLQLFVILFFCIIPDISQAIPDHKTYIVGVEIYNKKPLHYLVDGEYKGKYREILDLFSKEKGYKFLYQPLKLNELYLKFYNGNIDFKFPDNPVWRAPDKNEHKVYYSSYVYNYIDAIFVKKKNLGKPLNFFKILGVIDDVLLWNITKMSSMNKIKIVKEESCKYLIQMLKEGKIDSIMCNYDVMQYYLKKSNSEKEIVFDTSLPYVDDYYYMSSMKHRRLILEFSKWVAKNRNKINAIINDDKEY